MQTRTVWMRLGLLLSAVLAAPASSASYQGVPSANSAFSGDLSKCQGYSVGSVDTTSTGGLLAELSLLAECNAFGTDIDRLTLSVEYESPIRLHVHLYDTAQQQYQVPLTVIERPRQTDVKRQREENELEFEYIASPFQFWITRKSDQSVLFDTRVSNIPTHDDQVLIGGQDSSYSVISSNALVFEDQYLQLSSALPKGANVYGLGEVIAESGYRRNTSGSVTTFWARDVGDPIDENMYGTHPMYMEYRWDEQSQKSWSHGVFLLNSNGMDVVMRDGVIQYRAIGGTLDLYFLSGPTPNDVAAQYAEVVGLPQQMPYWAFGFHLCKWAYTSVAETKEAVQAMRDAGIPLEAQWNDIDWMRHYRQGQFDENYSPEEYKAFVDWLHENNQHYVPIIDAAVGILYNETDTYDFYTRGHELDVWTKNPDGTEYIGSVWPGLTVFPDWFHPHMYQVWHEFLHNLSTVVAFDGIWLDMNEPSSFITGSAMNSTVHLNWTERAPGYQFIPVERPEDWPEGYNNFTSGLSGNISVGGKLTYGADGARPVPTNTAQAMPGASAQAAFKLPANIPASSVGSHELEQRGRTPSSAVKRQRSSSVPQIPNPDTPAYSIRNGGSSVLPLAYRTVSPNATLHGGLQEYSVHNLWGSMEEMATNSALQAIQPGKRPFIISRSTFAGAGRKTGHWLGDNASTWAYMKRSIQGVLQFNLFGVPMVGPDTGGFGGNTNEELLNRWSMLSAFFPFYRNHNTKGAIPQEPYRWDSVRDASIKAIAARYKMLPYWETLFADVSAGGAPPVTPLFHHFDHPRYLANDYQFLVGPNVLVTPQLQPNQTAVRAQVPNENGAAWFDWWTHDKIDSHGKDELNVDVPLGHIGVWVRSGSIIPLHESAEYTLKETRESGYSLLVALDSQGRAEGRIKVDDGISLPVTESTEIIYAFENNKLAATVRGNHHIHVSLKSITVLGIKYQPYSVSLNGKVIKNVQWNEAKEEVMITGLDGDMNRDWTLSL